MVEIHIMLCDDWARELAFALQVAADVFDECTANKSRYFMLCTDDAKTVVSDRRVSEVLRKYQSMIASNCRLEGVDC